MRQWVLLALLLLGAAVGCDKGQKTPEKTEARPAAPASSAPAPSAAPAASGQAGEAGGYALTREKLDAYVRYQKSLIGIYDTLLKDLEKLPAQRPDGGRPSPATASAAMRVLESKAKAEEKARAEANLSERDAREIEQMVMAIINKRNMGKSFDPSSAIKQWEAMRDKLPADRRAEVDKSINDLKEQQEEITRLTEERRQFGDANVDLILTREDELTQNYNAYLARLTGRR